MRGENNLIENKKEKVLYSREAIQKRVKEMGAELEGI